MPNPENVAAHKWKPGQPGNPKGYSRARRMMNALHRKCDEAGNYDAFIAAGWDRALGGEFPFWRYLFELIAPPETSADGLAAAKLKALEAASAGHGQQADPQKPE